VQEVWEKCSGSGVWHIHTRTPYTGPTSNISYTQYPGQVLPIKHNNSVFGLENDLHASVVSSTISGQPCWHSTSIDSIRPQCTPDKDRTAHMVYRNQRESNQRWRTIMERDVWYITDWPTSPVYTVQILDQSLSRSNIQLFKLCMYLCCRKTVACSRWSILCDWIWTVTWRC